MRKAVDNCIMSESVALHHMVQHRKAFQRHAVSMNLDLCPCCPHRPDGSRAEIYLKREDLNHTGAHKINNSLGQVCNGTALCFSIREQWVVAHMAAVCAVHLSC